MGPSRGAATGGCRTRAAATRGREEEARRGDARGDLAGGANEQRLGDLFDCWGCPSDTISDANLRDNCIDHTAYQWCVLRLVPIVDAWWKPVTYGHSDSTWYYRSKWDVRYEPDRAKELLKTEPREYDRLPGGRPYDGHLWWKT